MTDSRAFLRRLSGAEFSNLDRAIAVLWWNDRHDGQQSMKATEIGGELLDAGYSAQNNTRLNKALSKDPRTRKVGAGFGVSVRSTEELSAAFGPFTQRPAVAAPSALLPDELFYGTRGYVEKVVLQINASYAFGLYDCCTVMCRRLLETLIIEVFEHRGNAEILKDGQGNYFMFSGLLAGLYSDNAISLSRETKKGLDDFKKLGDRSAHNRRYNARRNDIDRVRDGMRVGCEDLLHLAGLSGNKAAAH